MWVLSRHGGSYLTPPPQAVIVQSKVMPCVTFPKTRDPRPWPSKIQTSVFPTPADSGKDTLAMRCAPLACLAADMMYLRLGWDQAVCWGHGLNSGRAQASDISQSSHKHRSEAARRTDAGGLIPLTHTVPSHRTEASGEPAPIAPTPAVDRPTLAEGPFIFSII